MGDQVAVTGSQGGPSVVRSSGQPTRASRVTFFGTAATAVTLLAGTGTFAAPDRAESHFESHWGSTSTGTWNPNVIEVAVRPDRPTLKDLVNRLREMSGLTWDQLSRIFGVSRRAMHLWASGGRMNARHAEILHEVMAVVRNIPGDTPDQRRAYLLTPGSDGRSPYENLRALREGLPGVNAPAFSPEELTGVLHDDDRLD